MGAAGGIASFALTQAGLNVVGLEAGPRLSNKDFIKRLDELGEAFQFRNSLGAPKFNREIPTWRLNAKAPTVQQPPGIFAMANCVGGSSVHYGAQSWRMHDDDFTIRSSTIKRYGKGALPRGTNIIDWGVTYADLEPYYDKVEYLIGVSGKAGNVGGKTQPGGNPFEAPRSRDYPMPPLRSLEFADKLGKAMHETGYHPFPQPAAITSENFHGRPACSYCGFCGYGFGCWNNSKSSTLVSAIKDAEKTGKLEIRTDSSVMKITSDAHGRVTGVEYRDAQGNTHEQPAKFVILSSYIYENNRLLLLSKSGSYPHGLSNNHGQLGKYFMSQIGAGPGVNGVFNERLNLWGGTSGQTVVMDDLDADNFDHHGLGFIRGGSIQVSTNGMPIAQSTTVPPDVPLWGSAYKKWLHNIDYVGGLAAQTDVLPYEANFVDLDPVKKDEHGVPVLRVTYNVYENEQKMAAYLTERMTRVMKAAGAKKIWGGGIAAIPVSSHAYGGTRMGEDPGNSVVNQFSISHESPNLAVMGGSTFSSTSGFNPTETIEALAWYGADYIAKNFETLT